MQLPCNVRASDIVDSILLDSAVASGAAVTYAGTSTAKPTIGDGAGPPGAIVAAAVGPSGGAAVAPSDGAIAGSQPSDAANAAG
mmetsp:Transcript_22479/g.38404  ORF Transcript_22479/g.38404 Transcript_22479/m.38404 type:complete len:84 (-) Transcript_22479:1036-1287(-)